MAGVVGSKWRSGQGSYKDRLEPHTGTSEPSSGLCPFSMPAEVTEGRALIRGVIR